jgi:hypothetical protein
MPADRPFIPDADLHATLSPPKGLHVNLDPALKDELLRRLLVDVGADADTARVTALAIGGAGFALEMDRLLTPAKAEPAGLEAVVSAFFARADGGADGSPPGDSTVPAALAKTVARYGIDLTPAQLIDVMRADLLIHAGALEEISEAILAAMRLRRWRLANQGIQRLRDELGERAPRAAYGLGSVCLHELGEYALANDWVREGLGPQGGVMAQPELLSESQHFQLWGRHRRPVVSIICTTYNHERFVEKALHGFFSQACEYPFEVLLHDDASTDGTADIIRQWHSRYPQIIKPVLQSRNQYALGKRPFELMLAQAQGEFVAVCEGDDFWIRADKLQRQVDTLRGHADLSSCAHNYYHLRESDLSVKPWSTIGHDFFLTPRQLMQVATLLWLPTLMFRRSFSAFPPERRLAALGDAFLTSYLGTKGPCAYMETFYGAVRRENEFSLWSPMPAARKQAWCIQTWTALQLMHERLGQTQAVEDLRAKIDTFGMPKDQKDAVVESVLQKAGQMEVA